MLFSAFNVAHAQASVRNGGDFDCMQPDRIRPVRRTGAEHARDGPVRIAARVNDKHIPLSTIQPGEHDYPVTLTQALKAVQDGRCEDQPRLRRTLVRLMRR